MSTRPIYESPIDRIEEKKEVRFSPYQSRRLRNHKKVDSLDSFLATQKKDTSFFELVKNYRKKKGLSPVPKFEPTFEKKN